MPASPKEGCLRALMVSPQNDMVADARRRRERRFKSAQVDPDDEEEVSEMLELAEDESITYGEE